MVSVHVSRLESSRPRGESEAGDEGGDDEGINKSVLLQKTAQPLVSSHPEDLIKIKSLYCYVSEYYYI